MWNSLCSCPVCHNPLAIVVASATNPTELRGNLQASASHKIIAIYPKAKISRSPDDVPEASAKAYIQGADSLKDRRTTAAVAMFRRTIDVATKQYSDEIQAWNLEKRIDKLAAAGLITKDLQQWAHKIRLEGNGALHELDEPTFEQATELELFTELMLTYLFTLPAKIRVNLEAAEK